MITSEEDGIWLGSGMYFWDNRANADYWYNRKAKNVKEISIVQANVYTDHMLDLTDLDICNKTEQLWESYKKKIGVEGDTVEDLGYKLNVLYKYFAEFSDIYHVIKIYGKYNYTPPNKFFSYNIRSDKAEPITSVKCIYSVRNVEAIAQRGWVEGKVE